MRYFKGKGFNYSRRWLYATFVVIVFFSMFEMVLSLLGVSSILDEEDPYVGFSEQLSRFEKQLDKNGLEEIALVQDKRELFNSVRFPASKKTDTFRIFCLGGSTTYGRPYNEQVAFCSWLQDFLDLSDLSRRWEVLNVGAISFASYRVAALMKELTEYQPDMFVVYSGHNEFLEERTYREIAALPAWLRDFNTELSRSLVFSVMKRGLRKIRLSFEEKERSDVVISSEVDEILNHTVGPESYQRDNSLKESIENHYRFNIERMIHLAKNKDSKIVFIQPASKLRDESPFKSSHRDGLDAQELHSWGVLFEEAKRLFKENNYIDALNAIDQSLAIDDLYAEAHYIRGSILFELRRYEDSKLSYQRSLDEDIAPLRMTSNLQRVLREVTIENKVDLIDFPSIIASISVERYGHGLPGGDLFLDHVHPNIEMHRVLGQAVYEYFKKVGLLEAGSSLEPDALRGAIEARLAKVDTEMQQRSLHHLAMVIGWGGKLKEATDILLRSQREFGNTPRTLLMLSNNFLKRGLLSDALSFAEEATRLYPDNFSAWAELADLHEKSDRLELAVAAYERAIGISPEIVGLHQSLASILIKLNRTQDAIKQIETIVKLAPEHEIAHLNLGVLYSTAGLYDRSERSLREALRIDPKLAYASFSLAVVLEQRKKYDEALSYYRKARRLGLDNAEVAVSIGVLLASKGELKMAVEEFKKALDISPGFHPAKINLEAARAELSGVQ